MNERRKEKRWLAYLGGRVSFSRAQSSADLLIRNVSASGAKLVVDNGNFIPDNFNLRIPAWQVEYRARARWRRYNTIGITFEEAPIPLNRSVPIATV